MNEIMQLSGNFGHPLPFCDACGSNHLYFVGDKKCLGSIRSMDYYFKSLYQHFLTED